MSGIPPAERAALAAYARPEKHSLTLKGHRSSVTLEPVFWAEFRRIARARGMAFNALAAEIDAARPPDVGLASAIRVFVLEAILKGADGVSPPSPPGSGR